ncbi:MAG: hypothetical protein Q4A79_03150 [Candidatus Saccharibacteria bacterium]|nr:hypothetical protein [Candidatus Saccharibacteria bacterium]
MKNTKKREALVAALTIAVILLAIGAIFTPVVFVGRENATLKNEVSELKNELKKKETELSNAKVGLAALQKTVDAYEERRNGSLEAESLIRYALRGEETNSDEAEAVAKFIAMVATDFKKTGTVRELGVNGRLPYVVPMTNAYGEIVVNLDPLWVMTGKNGYDMYPFRTGIWVDIDSVSPEEDTRYYGRLGTVAETTDSAILWKDGEAKTLLRGNAFLLGERYVWCRLSDGVEVWDGWTGDFKRIAGATFSTSDIVGGWIYPESILGTEEATGLNYHEGGAYYNDTSDWEEVIKEYMIK